MIVNSVKHCP